ncbi:MAG: Protein QmcA (possibly involved in integral membrane quality control), partial [uncultured Sphingomonas sp.]
ADHLSLVRRRAGAAVRDRQHQDRPPGPPLHHRAFRALRPGRGPWLQLRAAVLLPRRPQDQHDGAGSRHSGAGDHHQGQRHGGGGRRGFLPGARPSQGGVRGQRPVHRHPGALHHQPAHRHGLDGPRRDPVQARRDQHPAVAGGGSRHGGLGRQDHPGRTQGHPPARRHRQRHDPPDEGGTREARRHPRERGHARVRDPPRRGREGGADPPVRRPQGSRLPRRRSPRARGGGGGVRDQVGQRRHRRRQHPGDQLLHRAEICRSRRQVRGLAQRQDHPVPGRGHPADRLAWRHRGAGALGARWRRAAAAAAAGPRAQASADRPDPGARHPAADHAGRTAGGWL